MDRSTAINLTVIALIAIALFYPPAAQLLGDSIRILLQLGLVGGGLYLVFRYPWDALGWAVAITMLGSTIALLIYGIKTYGYFGGAVLYLGSTILASKVAGRLSKWIDARKAQQLP